MNRNRILLHLAFWVAYGLYDGYLNAPLAGSSYEHLSFWERIRLGYFAELVVLLYKVPATYLVLYWLVPRYFRTKKLVVFVVSLLAVAVTFMIVGKAFWYSIIYPHIYEVPNPEPVASFARQLLRWGWNSIDILLLMSVASAIKFFRLGQAAAERERQLVEEKLQSELNFLRAQTNPHFLFNTLNNLYHLARKRSEDTPEAILKLSNLMRFMLYECTSARIPAAQEVKVIRDYIELERLRYGDRLRVDFTVDMPDENQTLAPLLLLPFVENAFKHGASESQGETWVRFCLSLKNGSLDFLSENPGDPGDHKIALGIGLQNVKRQLELLYPEHQLFLENKNGVFKAHLQIPRT